MRRSLAAVMAAVAALVVQAAPALAQDSVYDRAVAARLAGDPALAVALLEPWLSAHPGDADALVQYGYALLALGEYDRAERAFADTLALAPEYTDAREGMALAAARRSDGTAARRSFVLAEGALSDLDRGQRDWHELGLAASLTAGERSTLDLRGSWYKRFGIRDSEFGALLTHRAGPDLWLRVGGSLAPHADFRPEVGASAGLDYRFAPHSVATIDASWQQFPAQTIWTLRPGFTQYLGGGRYAVTLQASAAAASRRDVLVGASVRGDYFAGDRTRFFAGAASGPETDLGIVRQTTSLFFGGEVALGGDVSLLGSAGREWSGIGADRSEARIGLKLLL